MQVSLLLSQINYFASIEFQFGFTNFRIEEKHLSQKYINFFSLRMYILKKKARNDNENSY